MKYICLQLSTPIKQNLKHHRQNTSAKQVWINFSELRLDSNLDQYNELKMSTFIQDSKAGRGHNLTQNVKSTEGFYFQVSNCLSSAVKCY